MITGTMRIKLSDHYARPSVRQGIFMKLTFCISLLVLCFTFSASAQEKKPGPAPAPAPSPSPAPAHANIAGKWSIAADAGGQTVNVAMELKQTGADFSGTMTSDVGGGTIEGGKMNGKAFTAVMKADVQGQATEFKMEGSLDGEKMTGTLVSAAFGSIPITGTRAK